MKKKSPYITVIFLVIVLLAIVLTGCLEEETPESEEFLASVAQPDQMSILPDWEDGEYHDYYETMEMLDNFNNKYSDLADVFSVGKSVLGRDIWCIKITNEKNDSAKFSCLIDGCIHGNEWEAGEACLYLADYLLINFGDNNTIANILNGSEIYIIPLVNPDGRQKNERWNDNGVDLNRNFDIFFGRIRGRCLRLGKLLGRIKIPYTRFPRLGLWFSNCGRRAFSEPEAQTMRDVMKTLEPHSFSFYVNCHTAVHSISASWMTHKPPFEMTQQEHEVIDYVLDWVEENTEYESSRDSMQVGGLAPDWCFQEFRIPSFCFEILSQDYEPFMGKGKHDHLVHWMNTTLPFFMYLLVNIEHLHNWEIPDLQPSLPEGVPPPPLN
ncbi:MAG: M14 family zinc carboxypeptidase [Petrotogales bacterium]